MRGLVSQADRRLLHKMRRLWVGLLAIETVAKAVAARFPGVNATIRGPTEQDRWGALACMGGEVIM